MLKTTGSFEVSAPRAFEADDDEVVGGSGSGADETMEILSKSRKSKIPMVAELLNSPFSAIHFWLSSRIRRLSCD